MELLSDAETLGYCTGSPEHREALWAQALEHGVFPYYLLPIFELCRMVHFGARNKKRFDVRGFRKCWSDLVLEHEDRAVSDGRHWIRLLEPGDSTSSNFPRDVWARALAPRGEDSQEGDSSKTDERGSQRDPRAFQVCFRDLASIAEAKVRAEADWEKYDHPLLDLPGVNIEPPEWPSEDLVLDTNFFVELMNELPVDGKLRTIPCSTGRPARALGSAARRFRDALETRGKSGHLIIPIAVLIEAYGIVRVKDPDKYKAADDVMRVIETVGDDWPLLNVFHFDPLSLEVLDAYVALHEVMAERVPDPNEWPDFTDAFVLAHGLVHACPVISGEWKDKPDWREAKKLFRHLCPHSSPPPARQDLVR